MNMNLGCADTYRSINCSLQQHNKQVFWGPCMIRSSAKHLTDDIVHKYLNIEISHDLVARLRLLINFHYLLTRYTHSNITFNVIIEKYFINTLGH